MPSSSAISIAAMAMAALAILLGTTMFWPVTNDRYERKYGDECEENLLTYKKINNFNWKEYENELLVGARKGSWGMEMPHIDAKEYADVLIKYVCGNGKDRTLIVGGAKDIGKSKGISSVENSAASKLGFAVFELNLKGTINKVDVKKVILDLSWDIGNTIVNVNDLCVLDKVSRCHAITQSWTLPYWYILKLSNEWSSTIVSILALLTISAIAAKCSSIFCVIKGWCSTHPKLSLVLAALLAILFTFINCDGLCFLPMQERVTVLTGWRYFAT